MPDPIPPMERRHMDRLESKVDDIAKAVAKLVLIEERQGSQSDRITRAEDATAKLEGVVKELSEAHRETSRRLEIWIQRGMTVWAVAVVVFSIVTQFPKI